VHLTRRVCSHSLGFICLTRRVCSHCLGFICLTRRVCSYATHQSSVLSSLDTPCPPREDDPGPETREAAVSKAKEDAAVSAPHRPCLQLPAPLISSPLVLSRFPSCWKTPLSHHIDAEYLFSSFSASSFVRISRFQALHAALGPGDGVQLLYQSYCSQALSNCEGPGDADDCLYVFSKAHQPEVTALRT
jgi:hypothetical protein